MGQDRNAANEGDLLKHTLLAEVVGLTGKWNSLTYAETHGGAGIYHARNQDKEPHIQNLRKRIKTLEKPTGKGAGGRYTLLLKEWWEAGNRSQRYPGSVLQVALLLRRLTRMRSPSFRVTEACKENHRKLTNAVSSFGIKPELAGFQDKIEWLTRDDPLLLLIDPFTYTNNKKALALNQAKPGRSAD